MRQLITFTFFCMSLKENLTQMGNAKKVPHFLNFHYETLNFILNYCHLIHHFII